MKIFLNSRFFRHLTTSHKQSRYMRKNQLVFYFAYFIATIAIALPHSVLTVLLLNKGLNLSEIVFMQTSYNIAVVLFEFPSGVLGDIFSRKTVYLISKFFLIMMFLLVLTQNNYVLLLLAWFIYGIASALESGTIDNQIISSLKKKQSVRKNSEIFRMGQQNILTWLNFRQFFGCVLLL